MKEKAELLETGRGLDNESDFKEEVEHDEDVEFIERSERDFEVETGGSRL